MKRTVGFLSVLAIAAGALGHAPAAPAAPFAPGRDWIEVHDPSHPPARGALVYDSARKENVLFVPAVRGGRGAETWTFNGATRNWTKKNPATVPLLYRASAAWDAARKEVVLVGCRPTAAVCDITTENRTWTWNGIDWTKETPATPLVGKFGAALSYDAARGVVVAVSTEEPILLTAPTSTWTWNGTNWLEAGFAAAAQSRGLVTAYDKTAKRVRMFGGLWATRYSTHCSGDTKQWNGNRWSLVDAGDRAGDPLPRAFASMAWDHNLGTLIMVGGSCDGRTFRTPYVWDGMRWVRMITAHRPPPMEYAALADNPTSGVVLFNGTRTWVLGWATTPASPT